MYMSAPVVADGTLYGISNKRKGQFVALDVATGAVRWATEGREGDHASILLSPSHVLFLTNAGDLIVAKRDAAKFAEERRIEVADGETWAVPAFVPGGLVVRDAQGLVRLDMGKLVVTAVVAIAIVSSRRHRMLLFNRRSSRSRAARSRTTRPALGRPSCSCTARSWIAELGRADGRRFAKQFRVVRYDIRPFGESSHRKRHTTFPTTCCDCSIT